MTLLISEYSFPTVHGHLQQQVFSIHTRCAGADLLDKLGHDVLHNPFSCLGD
jgi:hypothetical protein